MSNISGFKEKMLSGQILAGTFLKTPNYILVEVLAQSKLDFICIDAEHAPFDRAALDQCLAISRALDFPVFVRVGEGSAKEILWALDSGAVGLVIPHEIVLKKLNSFQSQRGMDLVDVDLQDPRVGQVTQLIICPL